jgi:hypothetical protein
LLLVLGFAYLAFLVVLGQERALDWGLSDDEMFFPEELLSLAMALGIFSTWILSMYRAHLAGSWRWFVVCLIFFPAAYVYSLMFNKGLRPNSRGGSVEVP